jgi:uroporphyrinogen-III decarboxylase
MKPTTMTSKERLWAAINLQPVDRVPVGFGLSWFAATNAGISMADFTNDCEANFTAANKLFDDLDGLDFIPMLGFSPALGGVGMPMQQKLPGKELPSDSIIQYHEKELMTPAEYDIVIDKGWRYYEREYIFPRAHPEFSGPSGSVKLQAMTEEANNTAARARDLFGAKGTSFFDGVMAMPPFEILSMGRSFGPFLLDLIRRPDKVIAAMDVMMAETMEGLSSQLKTSRPLFGNTPISRSASTFISPAYFEKFVFPYIKQIAGVYMAANLCMVFHLDQNWLKFLPYFRELPPGKYIVELDGCTDIFEAKKILGDRMCLMGDVPARLFKLGTVQEVERYCRRLIDEAGKGSGFILSSG